MSKKERAYQQRLRREEEGEASDESDEEDEDASEVARGKGRGNAKAKAKRRGSSDDTSSEVRTIDEEAMNAHPLGTNKGSFERESHRLAHELIVRRMS